MEPRRPTHPATFLDALALANLPVRLGVEIATVAAVAWSSWRLAPGPVSGAVMAVVAPVALSMFWATFVSPKARVPVRGLPRLGAEVLVFGSGVVGLWLARSPSASVVLGTLAGLSLAVTHALGDPRMEDGDD